MSIKFQCAIMWAVIVLFSVIAFGIMSDAIKKNRANEILSAKICELKTTGEYKSDMNFNCWQKVE